MESKIRPLQNKNQPRDTRTVSLPLKISGPYSIPLTTILKVGIPKPQFTQGRKGYEGLCVVSRHSLHSEVSFC